MRERDLERECSKIECYKPARLEAGLVSEEIGRPGIMLSFCCGLVVVAMPRPAWPVPSLWPGSPFIFRFIGRKEEIKLEIRIFLPR